MVIEGVHARSLVVIDWYGLDGLLDGDFVWIMDGRDIWLQRLVGMESISTGLKAGRIS